MVLIFVLCYISNYTFSISQLGKLDALPLFVQMRELRLTGIKELAKVRKHEGKSCLVLSPICVMGWFFIFQEDDNGIRVLNVYFYL